MTDDVDVVRRAVIIYLAVAERISEPLAAWLFLKLPDLHDAARSGAIDAEFAGVVFKIMEAAGAVIPSPAGTLVRQQLALLRQNKPTIINCRLALQAVETGHAMASLSVHDNQAVGRDV